VVAVCVVDEIHAVHERVIRLGLAVPYFLAGGFLTAALVPILG
jgi:hypothetical protein